MYRNVILDFISNNHKTLISNEYLQMTFVFLQFDVDDLGKFGIDIGNIMIYHVKEPYVFEKQYDIGKLAGTIIEILLTSKEPLTFLYDEVTFEINDPFYLKDLRKQTFLQSESNFFTKKHRFFTLHSCFSRVELQEV